MARLSPWLRPDLCLGRGWGPFALHYLSSCAWREVCAPVLLQAVLVGFGAHRALLAVADGLQPVGGNPELYQTLLGGSRPAITQARIVFDGAVFVGMPLLFLARAAFPPSNAPHSRDTGFEEVLPD